MATYLSIIIFVFQVSGDEAHGFDGFMRLRRHMEATVCVLLAHISGVPQVLVMAQPRRRLLVEFTVGVVNL